MKCLTVSLWYLQSHTEDVDIPVL